MLVLSLVLSQLPSFHLSAGSVMRLAAAFYVNENSGLEIRISGLGVRNSGLGVRILD